MVLIVCHLVKKILENGNSVVATDIKPKEYWFQDLEVDELFWQTNKPKEGEASIPWRKTSLTEATNLKTQKTYSFQGKTKVFQKI